MAQDITKVLEELSGKESISDLETFLHSLDDEVLKGIFLSVDEPEDGERINAKDHVIFFDHLPDELKKMLGRLSTLYDFINDASYDIVAKVLFLAMKKAECITSDQVTDILEQFFDNPIIAMKSEESFTKTLLALKNIVSEDIFEKTLINHADRQVLIELLANNVKKNGSSLKVIMEYIITINVVTMTLLDYIRYGYTDNLTDKEVNNFDSLLELNSKFMDKIMDVEKTESSIDEIDIEEYCDIFHLGYSYSLVQRDASITAKLVNTNIEMITKFRDAIVDNDMDKLKEIFDQAEISLDAIKETKERLRDEIKKSESESTTEKKENVRSKLKRQ